jgi:signal transduction histidine kinase
MTTNAAATAAKMVSNAASQMDTGIAILNGHDIAAAWNPRAVHLSGHTLEAINAIGFLRIFEPVETMQQLIQKARGGISAASARVQLRRADGQLILVEVECSSLLHSEHGEERIVVAMRELDPSQGGLSSGTRLQMLGHLARSLSHEIRNPVNAIFLHTDIIEEELRQPALNNRLQVEQSLGTIKTEVTRLNDLVQDYFSLARLSDLRRQPEDVRDFLEALAREVPDQITSRGVSLHLEGLEGLGQIALHRPLLRRALLNLMQYAMEAMPEGGSLTLRGWRTASRVHLAIHDARTVLQIDTLPPPLSPRPALELEGNALGVYVAHEIVAAHGGVLEATSAADKGATVILTLPVDLAEHPANG